MVFTRSVWNGVAVSPSAARQTPHVISTVLLVDDVEGHTVAALEQHAAAPARLADAADRPIDAGRQALGVVAVGEQRAVGEKQPGLGVGATNARR